MTHSNAQKLKDLIASLQERKTELESQRSITDIVRERLEIQWTAQAEKEEKDFLEKLPMLKKIILLENGIVESIRPFISESLVNEVKAILKGVRKSDDLSPMKGMHLRKEIRNDIKTKRVLKLVTAIYRYNRSQIQNKPDPKSLRVSAIRMTVNCPHCCEVSRQIIRNMMITKVVLVPPLEYKDGGSPLND